MQHGEKLITCSTIAYAVLVLEDHTYVDPV